MKILSVVGSTLIVRVSSRNMSCSSISFDNFFIIAFYRLKGAYRDRIRYIFQSFTQFEISASRYRLERPLHVLNITRQACRFSRPTLLFVRISWYSLFRSLFVKSKLKSPHLHGEEKKTHLEISGITFFLRSLKIAQIRHKTQQLLCQPLYRDSCKKNNYKSDQFEELYVVPISIESRKKLLTISRVRN